MSYTDRAFVLLANRLIRPKSEHGLPGWLETDYVCTRDGRRFVPAWFQHNRVRVHHRQLDAWYRTLDRLVAAKSQIEVALYHHFLHLFHLRPEFVLYDLTSVYFEGAADPNIAIEAHIFMATLALLLERRLKVANMDLSAASALEAVSTIRRVLFQMPDGPPRQGTSRGSPRAAQVLNALKITDRSPPPPPEGQDTVL